MSPIVIIAIVILVLACFTLYEVNYQPKNIEKVKTFMMEVFHWYRDLYPVRDNEPEVVDAYDSDFNVGYQQGYKAALITAHSDAMMCTGEGSVELKHKLSQRMREAMPEEHSSHPNRMAVPSFVSVYDNALTIEWIFGDHGKDDSWRVMYSWDAVDGAMACRIANKDGVMEAYEQNDPIIADKLAEWLYGK